MSVYSIWLIVYMSPFILLIFLVLFMAFQTACLFPKIMEFFVVSIINPNYIIYLLFVIFSPSVIVLVNSLYGQITISLSYYQYEFDCLSSLLTILAGYCLYCFDACLWNFDETLYLQMEVVDNWYNSPQIVKVR